MSGITAIDQNQYNNKLIKKQLKLKASEFLSSRKPMDLMEIISYFLECVNQNQPVSPCLFTLEIIFTELLRKREMCIEIKPLKPKDDSPETKHKEWLQKCYHETWRSILICLSSERHNESIQALVTSMKLLSNEGKYPIESNALIDEQVTPSSPSSTYYFPLNKFRTILVKLLPTDKLNSHLIERFQEYSDYLDIMYYTWKLMPGLTPKGTIPSENFALNYLSLINAIPVTKYVQCNKKLLCSLHEATDEQYSYNDTRKCINKAWNCVMQWEMTESIHKQVLIVLLERILPHIEKPVALTDFLMDSLDVGGPVSLLALQGVFTLLHKHNITYPDIYEKLYSMFEPEIFHTKYKARLFYLADTFLSSTHLPENLVAAFVKRLARLTLIAPPQDIIIIIYFIGNLIIRHPGLKRLMFHPSGGEVSHDPYIMDERDPTKSYAIESSLWEIMALQSHTIPSIAAAAKFISKPLPEIEWDLSTVLGTKEDDLLNEEFAKKAKQFALQFNHPISDQIKLYWEN